MTAHCRARERLRESAPNPNSSNQFHRGRTPIRCDGFLVACHPRPLNGPESISRGCHWHAVTPQRVGFDPRNAHTSGQELQKPYRHHYIDGLGGHSESSRSKNPIRFGLSCKVIGSAGSWRFLRRTYSSNSRNTIRSQMVAVGPESPNLLATSRLADPTE